MLIHHGRSRLFLGLPMTRDRSFSRKNAETITSPRRSTESNRALMRGETRKINRTVSSSPGSSRVFAVWKSVVQVWMRLPHVGPRRWKEGV